MTRVLLADPDLVVRSSMALLLRHKLGVEDIFEISDAGQLHDRARVFRPDLLLLDWQLPGLDFDGLRVELLRPDARPVVIVMSIQSENEPWALASGADGFINKRAPGAYVLDLLRKFICVANESNDCLR
jgi:two-component system, NarL family, response regulator DesR